MASSGRLAVYAFGAFVLDCGNEALRTADGAEIYLRAKSFALLRLMVENAGRLLTRETIMGALWPNLFVTDDNITQCVSDVRRALGPEAGHLLRTIPRRGYIFDATVVLQPCEASEERQELLAPERRQLTVMICDVVGLAALSNRLDPEDLREVTTTCHRCCKDIIEHYHGYVSSYATDGLLAYFGYPQADEHDGERAVRAGLALVATGSKFKAVGGEDLRLRVGIATGLVVTGDPSGSAAADTVAVVGTAPNLAARLHALAAPDEIVIAASTRQLLGGAFKLTDLGERELNGFAEPVRSWRVERASAAESRFDARYGLGALTPLVGRQEELDLLLRRWSQAQDSEGQVVLLSGEPGIGKSRVLSAIRERLDMQGVRALRLQCSPHHVNSAFWPIISYFERTLAFGRDENADAKLDRLEALVVGQHARPPIDVRFVASILSIPCEQRYGPLALTPQKHKDEMLRTLVDLIEVAARQQPSVLLLEDAHWADPGTLEVLDLLIDRVGALPLLIVLTHRPEFRSRWTEKSYVSALNLSKLTRLQSAAMVDSLANGRALPTGLSEQILTKTDGIPLFIEELTKSILESGEVQDVGDRYAYTGFTEGVTIPDTLRDLLMARMDRLGSVVRDVAQTGATIGREFGYALLASITDLPERQLHQALDRLVHAGLVFPRGAPPKADYLFKHALVRDAAYGSLLRGRRQSLHRRIVEILEEQFPEIVQVQPALLAYHCREAGLAEQAVTYWLKAGQQALARSTMVEAVAQLRKGLDALATLPAGPWRQQQELDLQVTLGYALTATQGHTAVEVFEVITRVRALAEQLDRPEYLMPPIGRQYWFHTARSEHRLALALAEELEAIGKTRNETEYKWLGRFMQGVSRFQLGEFIAARAMLEQCTDLDEPTRCKIRSLGSTDQYLTMLAFLALALAYLGYIDQARSTMNEALWEARRLQHVYAVVYMLFYASWLDRYTGSPQVHIEELQSLATEHNYPLMLAVAPAIRGWSLITLGQAREGLTLCTQALSMFRAMGQVAGTVGIFASLAMAHASLGQPDEARDCLAEAARIIETTDERFWEAEVLYRIPGDLLNAAGDQSGAERHYRQAIDVAERQNAKLLQLRATTSLARLWRDQDKRANCYDLLAPIYGWFTEGFDAPILKEAKALLDELA
jgi:class 3 adenylate cyclase/tetratricopeptide (TPR) repeat protein